MPSASESTSAISTVAVTSRIFGWRFSRAKGTRPLVTAAESLPLPSDCCHAARAALFSRMDRGPIRGFPLIELEVRLLAATHLPAYSSPDAFALVATMALEQALTHAAPIVLEPWIGLRLRVKGPALSDTLNTLTRLWARCARRSLGDYFILDTEIPARLERSVASAFRLAHLDTSSLDELERYRPLSGPLGPAASENALPDWT